MIYMLTINNCKGPVYCYRKLFETTECMLYLERAQIMAVVTITICPMSYA